MTLPRVISALLAEFPADAISTDAADLAEYGKDWTKVIPPAPLAILFPKSTEEVARMMKIASEHDQPVVPSGGRTGLAAGAVAARGELVLSLSKMRKMGQIDFAGNTLHVEAGAVTQAVHDHCAPHGLTWPVDFASRGSSHVGGNISTNAGGVKVIRYGLTRNWVLGLRVVLASGEILDLNGALEKNNTGIDLRQLFIGSEGTLGIVTEATLKLTRVPDALSVMMFAVPSLEGVLNLFAEAKRGPFTIMAYEFFTDVCLARLMKHRKVRSPFSAPSPYYVLLEAEKAEESALLAWVESVFEKGLANDGTLAQHASQAAELWTLREGISESLSATGFPHKNDIALPIASLDSFCKEFNAVFESRYPGWEICIFGHVGDGNLHVNVMKPDALEKADFVRQTKEADRDMFALVKRHGGSISAEHGIGLLKKDYLGYSRSESEIALMRAMKKIVDPKGILNPGKIF